MIGIDSAWIDINPTGPVELNDVVGKRDRPTAVDGHSVEPVVGNHVAPVLAVYRVGTFNSNKQWRDNNFRRRHRVTRRNLWNYFGYVVVQPVAANDLNSMIAVVGNLVFDPGTADLPDISRVVLSGRQFDSIGRVVTNPVVLDVDKKSCIRFGPNQNPASVRSRVGLDNVAHDFNVLQVNTSVEHVQVDSGAAPLRLPWFHFFNRRRGPVVDERVI